MRRAAWLWLGLVGVAYVAELLWWLSYWKLWRYSVTQIWWAALVIFYVLPWALRIPSLVGAWLLFDIRSRGGGRFLWRWLVGVLLASTAFGAGGLLMSEVLAPGPLTGWAPSFYGMPVLSAAIPAIWVLTAKSREMQSSHFVLDIFKRFR